MARRAVVVGRHVIDRAVADLLEPVVGARLKVHDLHALLDHRDEGQEQGAVEAAAVLVVGRQVRRRDDDDAMLEQRLEQAPEDHRVGDVGDGELVEAEQRRLLGERCCDRRDRVVALDLAALQLLAVLVDALVHVGHEDVEMGAALRARGGVVEQVHEHGLAAPDRAPDVDAARRLRRLALAEEPAERARFAGQPVLLERRDEPVERRHRRELPRVALERAAVDEGLVAGRDRTGNEGGVARGVHAGCA